MFAGNCREKPSDLIQDEEHVGYNTNQLFKLIYTSNPPRWEHPTTCTGRRPPPRYYQGYTQIKNIGYLFGGRSGSGGGTYLNDLHTINLETLTWTKVDCGGLVPSGRSRCAMAALNGQLIVLYGGWDGRYSNLDDCWCLDTNGWKQLPIPMRMSVGPHGHTLTRTDDARGVVLFGGCSDWNSRGYLNTLQSFIFQ